MARNFQELGTSKFEQKISLEDGRRKIQYVRIGPTNFKHIILWIQ